MGAVLVIGIIGMVLAVGILALWMCKDMLKDVNEVQKHRRNDESLLIDLYAESNTILTHGMRNIYKRVETWTDKLDREIYRMGYYESEKFLDDVRYLGIPTYIRLHNFTVVEPADNMMTSGTLNDYCHSSAQDDFLKGMTKIQFNPIDMKTLGIMIPVVIGLVIGALYFILK